MSEAGALLEIHMRELGLQFVPEFKFYTERKWRADYLISPKGSLTGILVEIEGAVWTGGRHTRGAGYTADLSKYRTASALGFKVFRFSTQEVLDGTAREFLATWAK